MMLSEEYFEKKSKIHLAHATWANDIHLNEKIQKIICAISPSSIIDLGSGDGRLLKLFNNIESRTALDISDSMLDKIGDGRIIRIKGDIHAIPAEDNCFEAAICRQVLHYCDLTKALREIWRILILDGYALIVQMTDYINVPDPWFNEWAAFKGIKNRKHLALSEIVDAAKSVGFCVEKIESHEMRLISSWENLYKKYNLVDEPERERLNKFFLLSSPAIKQQMEIEITRDQLKLNRLFSLVLLKKQACNFITE